jgi:D-alanine-D-alanine ligase
MRVGVTFNLKQDEIIEDQSGPCCTSEIQAEWDDWETIEAVCSALAERHEVIPLEAGENIYNQLQNANPDIVFNIAEGSIGPCREGHVPSILEYLNIPYTASDPLTLNLCLDKSRAKEVLAFHRLPTPRFRVLAGKRFSFNSLHYPLLVKPLYEGSSIGIRNDSIVTTHEQMREKVTWVLDRYEEPALVEEYLPGREFTVAVLGNGEQARMLPIVEINFDSLPPGVSPIYSYEAKWVWDETDNPLEIFECPARISPELQEEIEKISLRAYRTLRCRDWCRIDLRLDASNKPYIIELNPLPGILPKPEQNSCFPKAARAAGFSYNQLINTVLDAACRRYGIN